MRRTGEYYNENDARAAAWLRTLIASRCIPRGKLDSRSIEHVTAADLVGIRRAHFFAGIGGWPLALRLARWPASLPVWTGSCPCQPFSLAGHGDGFKDPRHLWPTWRRLIAECRPHIVFGEQVSSTPGLSWIDAAQTDMEAEGYTFGATDLCAASVGAPHIRQRLYFAAYDRSKGLAPIVRAMGHPGRKRCDQHAQLNGAALAGAESPSGPDVVGSSHWSACDWIACGDGKWRPIEPGTFPLAHGVPGRVGLLRGYGNAVVPQLAQVFVQSFLDSCLEIHMAINKELRGRDHIREAEQRQRDIDRLIDFYESGHGTGGPSVIEVNAFPGEIKFAVRDPNGQLHYRGRILKPIKKRTASAERHLKDVHVDVEAEIEKQRKEQR